MKAKFFENFIAGFFIFLFGSVYYLSLIHENWFILILPGIFLFFIYFFSRLDKLLLFIIFCAPLSLRLSELLQFEFLDLLFPTEPLLFSLMSIVIFKMVYNISPFKRVLSHNISFFIFIYLVWMLFCSFTSTIPLVSLKLLVTRLWYIFPCFIFATLIFVKDQNKILYFIFSYCISFSFVIVNTLIKHSTYFFSGPSSNWVVTPFFDDHTSYGAMLAFFIPVLFLFSFTKKINSLLRFLSFILFSLFFVAIIFSYTRAAWVSLFGAIILGLIIKSKLKLRHIFGVFLVFVIMLIPVRNQVYSIISDNKQDSSSSYFEHIKSIYNIKSDASNMERINRWKCAVEMFKEKPLVGFGPGTYQFQYGVFQLKNDKTIISTSSGDMGNAHSEYLSALSETGIIGLLLLFFLIISIYYKSIVLYYEESDEIKKIYLLGCIVGLSTYFIHGLFNNFLDLDKAAIPIWFFVAIIVSIDITKTKT
tara:strand:+ start:414 stop:1841 length:1428 start_codon:yes stop_codon:yes gene_type:complete